MKRLYALQSCCIEKFKVDKEAYDYISYEIKNNFLHHIEELISQGEAKETLISFINKELQDPIYHHLFSIYRTKENLSSLNKAVKEKDAHKIYELSVEVSKKHKMRRFFARIVQKCL